MNDVKMEVAIIFEPHLTIALRKALAYAGEEGFVASMPQLLHARVQADYDNIIWNTWFTSTTEENIAEKIGIDVASMNTLESENEIA